MEFFDYRTAFDGFGQQGARYAPDAFLKAVKRQLDQTQLSKVQKSVEILRFDSESLWDELSRPYFKIWPEVIPLLTNVSIDVPANLLRLPFPAFVLRLPTKNNPLIAPKGHQVQSILAIEQAEADEKPVIVLWIDIGETEPQGSPMLHWSKLDCGLNRTIEEAFGGPMMPDLPGIAISDQLKRDCLRLAVSICFLSTGMDRLIEPDVLSKDLAAYTAARQTNDERRIRNIEQRAIRRGKNGWNVGQHERLRHLISRPNDSDSSGTRGPLSYQHQRRAHFRTTACSKVVFVRQATIRPDLPPPEHSPGYAVQ